MQHGAEVHVASDVALAYYADGPELAPPAHHPRTQPVPGPADRLPADWQSLLGQ